MKRIKGRKVSSRSMARENGYEIERQVPLVEEKEVIQEMSTPQEVSADELLHKTVAEQMESAKLEKM